MSPKVVTTAEKVRRLPWYVAMQASNSIFCYLTVFGPLFVLFLGEMGLPKGRIGFLTSLFPFCGLLALFVAPMTERMGVKRAFLIFYGVRKIFVALLLFTPLVLAAYNLDTAFYYVAIAVALFAVARAIDETAFCPWSIEFIPDTMRGKYNAITNIVATLATGLAIIGASFAMARSTGLSAYMGPFAVGVLFGLASVAAGVMIPGGAPVQRSESHLNFLRRMFGALRDHKFRLFMVGIGLVSLGWAAAATFLPLYLREQVGLSSGMVLILTNGALLGTLISSYLWGWAADRYGSKPVMLTSLNLLLLLPICWWLLPRGSAFTIPCVLAFNLLSGAVLIGWGIAADRHLYVDIVPPEKKMHYLTLYYAFIGVVGGIGPLAAGQALEYFSGLKGNLGPVSVDPYTPLFAAGFLLLLAGFVALSRIRAGGTMPSGRFVGMFLQGNPFMALESMVRYNFAGDEDSRVSVAERLGEARSPLNVDELVEALSDPSFNVRYEAVISIARTRDDRRFVNALARILHEREPDLAVAAAWALGRMGNRAAIPALRRGLQAELPLLRARCARALGMLEDVDSIPAIMQLFRLERNSGIRMAYASALGVLRARETAPELLDLLRSLDTPMQRMELALAIAQMVGDEEYFVRLHRDGALHPGMVYSQALEAIQRKIVRHPWAEGAAAALGKVADIMAQEQLEKGARVLAEVIGDLHLADIETARAAILRECVEMLRMAPQRQEYTLLALHTLDAAAEEA